jgi:hypothetical protein
MATPHGTLIERLVGAQIYFAADGALIGAASAAISNSVPPLSTTDYATIKDYNLGRITSMKYEPEFKETTREWAAGTGGYKLRKDKKVISDNFTFVCIEYAPQLYDQLMFGTAALAAPGSQTAFSAANRYKDGWIMMKRLNEAGVAIGLLCLHVRLSINSMPEDKNEPGSPEWRIQHLADAWPATLDTITFLAG